MFTKTDIESVFNIKLEQSSVMNGAIENWLRMYCSKDGLSLPAAIASETARLVTLEMKSEITGSVRADFLMSKYKPFLSGIRNITELAAASGGVVLKPYTTSNGIAIDVVRPDRFIPTEFDDDGIMRAAIFIDRFTAKDKYYTRLEYHRPESSGYTVTNKVFVSENNTDLGRQLPISSVPKWAALEEEAVIENITDPLFAYFKMPMANNTELDSPLGVSVYARAEREIADAAEQYERIKWEFESGDRFLGLSSSALRRDRNGNVSLPKREERLFKLFEWDEDNGSGLFKDWSPTLREQSYINGLNEILRKIEFNCGLAYGTLSDVSQQEKTAEEVKASKQRSYSHIADIQKSLRTALEMLVSAMDKYTTLYSLAPVGTYETSFEFDDSIVADRKTEFSERMELTAAGVIAPWEMRMWYTGETEEQAKAAVGVVDMMEE